MPTHEAAGPASSVRRSTVERYLLGRLRAVHGAAGGAAAASLAPVLIFFIIWNTIPVLWLLGLSFYRFSLTSGRPPIFAGLYNFRSILADTGIWFDLSRTFLFVICAVGIETALGLVLGLLFWNSQRLPGRRVALTLLFTPMVLTPVAAGTFWRLIYDPTFGVLNFMMRSVGLSTVDFLGNARTAFAAVLAVDVWMWTPFMVLMTLAALASVPKAELEASEIDRLTWLQRLRLIIFHHGKFILMLGVLLRTIDSFKTFDLIYDMTFGGPGSATQSWPFRCTGRPSRRSTWAGLRRWPLCCCSSPSPSPPLSSSS